LIETDGVKLLLAVLPKPFFGPPATPGMLDVTDAEKEVEVTAVLGFQSYQPWESPSPVRDGKATPTVARPSKRVVEGSKADFMLSVTNVTTRGYEKERLWSHEQNEQRKKNEELPPTLISLVHGEGGRSRAFQILTKFPGVDYSAHGFIRLRKPCTA